MQSRLLSNQLCPNPLYQSRQSINCNKEHLPVDKTALNNRKKNLKTASTLINNKYNSDVFPYQISPQLYLDPTAYESIRSRDRSPDGSVDSERTYYNVIGGVHPLEGPPLRVSKYKQNSQTQSSISDNIVVDNVDNELYEMDSSTC